MKRKFSMVLALVLLVSSMALPTCAVEPVREVQTITTEFGEFQIETTLLVYDTVLYSNTVRTDKKQVVKFNGKTVGEVTLTATFGYDGSSAWVISADGSHVTYSGWSYGSESISKSGRKAKLTAKLTHSGDSIPVSISMTCSPSGQIS